MSYRQRSEWIEDAKMRVLQNTRRTDEAARELIFLYDEAAMNCDRLFHYYYLPAAALIVFVVIASLLL